MSQRCERQRSHQTNSLVNPTALMPAVPYDRRFSADWGLVKAEEQRAAREAAAIEARDREAAAVERQRASGASVWWQRDE